MRVKQGITSGLQAFLKLESSIERGFKKSSRNHESFRINCLATFKGEESKEWGAFMKPLHYLDSQGRGITNFCYYPDHGSLSTNQLSNPPSTSLTSMSVYSRWELKFRKCIERIELDLQEAIDNETRVLIQESIEKNCRFRLVIGAEDLVMSCGVELLMITEEGEINCHLSPFVSPYLFFRDNSAFFDLSNKLIDAYDSGIQSKKAKFRAPYEDIEDCYFSSDGSYKPSFKLRDFISSETIADQLTPKTTGILTNREFTSLQIDHCHDSFREKTTMKMDLETCRLVISEREMT